MRSGAQSIAGLATFLKDDSVIAFTPTIAFFPDAVPDTARHVEELLREAAAADARVHEQAVGAAFAGDPDPYRAPREDVDDEADGQA